MIRLLTCFHTCEDLEVLSDAEWQTGSAEGRIDTSYLKKELNLYDESALELACRFAEQCTSDSGCSRAAVTVAEDRRDLFSGLLAAVGFDNICRIIPGKQRTEQIPAAGGLSSEYTAELLCAWIRRQKSFDLILTGWQSGDGNHGKVPLILAEMLGIRCITQVTAIDPVDSAHAEVYWSDGNMQCSTTITYPAVLSVGTAAGTALRVPTLRQRMAVRGIAPEIASAEDLQLSEAGHPVLLRSVRALTEARDVTLLEDMDAEAAAAFLHGELS